MDAKKLPRLLGLTVLTTVRSTGSVADMTLEAAVGQYMPVLVTQCRYYDIRDMMGHVHDALCCCWSRGTDSHGMIVAHASAATD